MERHVILRVIGGAERRSVFLGAGPQVRGTRSAGPTRIAIEVEEAGAGASAARQRDREIAAVAPVMPMKLISPVKRGVAAAAAPQTAWGVTAVAADSSSFTGDGIVVAVLDTGIDATHPTFGGVSLVQRNFTTDVPQDTDGHGTHCAGTIFGRSVDGTRIGVATGVKKALIGKILGDQGGSSEDIVNAIQWAVSEGAHVISMSLGMDFPGYQETLQESGFPPALATSRALEGYRANLVLFERLAATVEAMAGFGRASILVAAAGNESRTDEDPNFKIAVSPPAVADGMVSVGALGQGPAGFTTASFSNTGALVAGPGVDIVSARAGGGLETMSGTSMATPHVAGVAALWAESLASNRALTAAALTAKLIASGTTAGIAPGFDPQDVGTGMVQAPL